MRILMVAIIMVAVIIMEVGVGFIRTTITIVRTIMGFTVGIIMGVIIRLRCSIR
jgi:hypothetical protein